MEGVDDLGSPRRPSTQNFEPGKISDERQTKLKGLQIFDASQT